MGVREDVKEVWKRTKAKPGCAVIIVILLTLFIWLGCNVSTELTIDMMPGSHPYDW